MRSQLRILIKSLPAIPVYFYLFVLAVTSTSMFILLLQITQ